MVLQPHPAATMAAAEAAAEAADPEATWCVEMQAAHGVQPGVSWGSLSGLQQAAWGQKNCDAHVSGATIEYVMRHQEDD